MQFYSLSSLIGITEQFSNVTQFALWGKNLPYFFVESILGERQRQMKSKRFTPVPERTGDGDLTLVLLGIAPSFRKA